VLFSESFHQVTLQERNELNWICLGRSCWPWIRGQKGLHQCSCYHGYLYRVWKWSLWLTQDVQELSSASTPLFVMDNVLYISVQQTRFYVVVCWIWGAFRRVLPSPCRWRVWSGWSQRWPCSNPVKTRPWDYGTLEVAALYNISEQDNMSRYCDFTPNQSVNLER